MMSTFNELRAELRNKERSIKDLIRFIKTRTDNNPNYSLLLGAGCSISSGINSANTLIDKWQKDIYLQENEIKEDNYSIEKAKDFLAKQMWYDSRNPYSSLFEKKYDLPRQRRMFVEQEVRDKMPSIGYSYLIKLVENSYFKTLFTTNFDDLLNEAFYQYSNYRPILCAHDSSINSITITSKRPKIIKLHGDYLFDDIKSTLRETESLEDNIKNKFIEFAKDYGLILIGYGGNDRSIMDVLTYLLKNEDYFKHGIYWCIREDSDINEDLRKLLWKDRVFYVKIEGFDEFMAELHNKLNNAELPIDSSYLNEKTDNLILQMINNPYLIDTKCIFIQNDFKKLKNTKDKNIVGKFFEYLNESNDLGSNDDEFDFKNRGQNSLSEEDRKQLIGVQKEIYSNNLEKACKTIDDYINGIDQNKYLYVELLKFKGKCLRKLKNNEEAIICYRELIKLEKDNSEYYVQIFNLQDRFEDKLETINTAIDYNVYDYKIYFEKANLLFQNYQSSYDKSSLSYSFQEIENCADRCSILEPSIDNPIWHLKFALIKEKNSITDDLILYFEELLDELGKQDILHPLYVTKKIEALNLNKESNDKIYKYLNDCINNASSIASIRTFELTLLEEYAKNNDCEKLKKRFQYIEDNYIIDNEYIEIKATYLLTKFDQLDKAIEVLQSVKKKNIDIYMKLFQYLIFKGDLEKAKEIFNAHFHDNKLYEILLLEANGDFETSLKISYELINKYPNDYSINVGHSYLLLKNDLYEDAYNFLSKVLVASNFTDSIFLINYFIAMKNRKGNLKIEKVKEKILQTNTHSDLVQAGAYALIGDENNAFIKLSTVIKSDYSEKYRIRNMKVFEDLVKKERFQKLFGCKF